MAGYAGLCRRLRGVGQFDKGERDWLFEGNDRMRERGTVVMVTCEYPPFPGGIGTYSGELAGALVRQGHTVIVAGPQYDGAPDEGQLPGAAQIHRILKHHQIPPGAVPELLKLLRRTPRDALLLAADIRSLLLLYLLRPLHGRPYRVMVHGSEASKFKDGSWLFKLVRRAYLAAELVAYNSEATRSIFNAQVGRPAQEAVTYLGVADEWYSAAAAATFSSSKLIELPAGRPIFCSVGRLEPRKGHVETVRALALARDKLGMADPIYVVVGRAEDRAYEKRIAAEAEACRVTMVLAGRLSTDDIKLLYQRSSAHILFAQPLPGKIEGFGLVLVEAAAQSCPSIAARVGGIPEVLGDTGALVQPDDLHGLAAAALAYVQDPSVRVQAGEAARDRATRFSWSDCAWRTFPELFVSEGASPA